MFHEAADYALFREKLAQFADQFRVQLQESVPHERIVSVVRKTYAVAPGRMLRRAGGHREARRVARYLTSRHCRGRGSPTALAAAVAITVSELMRARGRVTDQLLRASRPANRVRDREACLCELT